MKINQNKAQAAIELAVFGAILIFLLGSILRAAVGNSYIQNQNLKAMRMGLINSWISSSTTDKVQETVTYVVPQDKKDSAAPPKTVTQTVYKTTPKSVSRTNSSVLFLEDRLSPDATKYGAMERTPYITSGSGTMSYQLMYPLDPGEVDKNLPLMDIYINGQHFPLTTAAYFKDQPIMPPPGCQPLPAGASPSDQCLYNQCLRRQREWVGGAAYEYQLQQVRAEPDAQTIFNELVTLGTVTANAGTTPQSYAVNDSNLSGTVWNAFTQWYANQFALTNKDLTTQTTLVQTILQDDEQPYQLFYTLIPNGTSEFVLQPPACSSHPCPKQDQELSSDMVLPNNTPGAPACATNPNGSNANGDLMFDLQRNANYCDASVPSGAGCAGLTSCAVTSASMATQVAQCQRCDMAWQWAATAGEPAHVPISATLGRFPDYDMFGRLKTQTIYKIGTDGNGHTQVSYLDPQMGDMDLTWDRNSCGVQPGLMNNFHVYTDDQNGTYLEIKEGKLYNPEDGQVVRSVNQRDQVDLIWRMVQLSNDTGHFCNGSTPQPDASVFGLFTGEHNPVEVCVAPGSGDTCVSPANFNKTCFDENSKILHVRSRLEDRRGHGWITDVKGLLGIQ